MTLAWFVEEALLLAGTSFHQWSSLPIEQQAHLIRTWEQHVGTKNNYVKAANLKHKVVPTLTHTGEITISYRTAEYLSVLAGQIPWGNQQRRSAACAELGELMNQVRLAGYDIPSQTLECFSPNTWEVHAKPIGGR